MTDARRQGSPHEWVMAGALGLATTLAGCPGDGEDDGADSSPTTTVATEGPGTGTNTDAPATTQTEATTTADPTDDGPLDSSGTEGSTDTDDPPTTGGADCGNGMLDPGEACDDGNPTDADGCNQDCTVSGSVLWFHSQASGTGGTDEFFAVAVDEQGRAYPAGDRFGTTVDMWARQYTEDDGLGWTQVFDGGSNDGAREIVRSGSTLFVAGYSAVAAQSNNVVLRGLSLDGSPGLSTQYNGVLSGSDVGQAIAVAPDGNLVVAGTEAVNLQGANAWIREYTPAGTPVWTAGYNGPASSTDQALAVATDAAGNVAAAGFHTVTGQGRDIWLQIYDTNGAPLWTATHGNLDGLDDEAWGVAFDPDGNVVVAGFELDPLVPWSLFVRKLDPNGNERWTTIVPGAAGASGVGWGVTIGPANRIWVAGGVDFGVDGRDAYVARIAP
ncbi:MAG: hypothetical protein AB1Z98_31825 [Nannocystaceae bacterium]